MTVAVKRLYLEPVVGLSILGSCRNVVVQHGSLWGRGPAPSVDKNSSFQGNEKQQFSFSHDYTLLKTCLWMLYCISVSPVMCLSSVLHKASCYTGACQRWSVLPAWFWWLAHVLLIWSFVLDFCAFLCYFQNWMDSLCCFCVWLTRSALCRC